MTMSVRALALFLGSLLLATWALEIVALNLVGDVTSPAMTPYLIGAMFMPTIWSLVYLTVFNRKAWKLVRFWPGNPLYLILAGLIPAAIAFITLALLGGQGWGASSFFNFNAHGATVLRGPWVMGDGAQGWAMFAANVAATAMLFAVLNSSAAIGEEFGWRGVLQHHMIERLGVTRGVALLGFVWAIWHAPVNLAGYNYPEAPILGALVLFPIRLIAVSFIVAWLTLRARSCWPAVLLHGSLNGIEEGVMSSLTLGAGMAPLTAKLIQLSVTVALGLLCLALIVRRRAAQASKSEIRPERVASA